MTRVLLVDDHELVRRGIRSVLTMEPEIAICGEAGDGREAIEKAKASRPDIIVMDISMPNMNGLDATREIKRILPQTQIIIVSQYDGPELARQAFDAGARTYIVKSSISTELLSAVREVSHSQIQVDATATHTKETQRQLQSLVQKLEARVAEGTRELENVNSALRELSGMLLQTQDEERRRIARDLHDGVGQILAALSMNLGILSHEKAKLSAEACRALDQHIELIRQASTEVRTVSHLLHPPLLDEVGLESALQWYVDGFAERSNIKVEMHLSSGSCEDVARDLALSLFRIVQESLTNIHRHSGSASAHVRIERTDDAITLEIRDEGRGIPEEIQRRILSGESAGVGLRGMRERIRQFGGRLELSSDGNGTRIIAILPVPTASAKRHESQDDDVRDNMEQKPGRELITILCIDDESEGLEPRRLLLESAGHRVLEARSGPEGIALFQAGKVDAVILDYWMSGMKGTAVASELKRINPSIPIIMLSGMSDLPGEAAGLVDRWIIKGRTRPEHLLDSLTTLLERRGTGA